MRIKLSILSLILTLPLLLGMLAGCNNTPAGPEQSNTDPAVTTQPEAPELTIEAGDGNATVTTESGFTYTASGYDTLGDKTFGFDNGLVLSFGDAFADSYNRFTMQYAATAPMKITVTYTEKGERTEDVFYLEATQTEFSAVNHKFLTKISGSNLESIRVDSCTGESAEFILYNLEIQTVSVPKAQLYLTGSRYTLGVDLKWGGTINILEDKNCPIADVTNLVNLHDEGRLIQQSYYGVFYRESEYKEGGYLGLEGVAYNPVQAGDVKGRESRLIDYKVEGNSIYIKVQPLDWPLSNSLTPSYMENKYTMQDEYIHVYNRFIDFSGWEHPTLDQELPAVYTVNVLDTFVWYNGNEPWTGGALTTVDDWSKVDPNTNKSSHYRQYTEANTETWCALIQAESQYGVGIYVPNVDRLLTMRYLSGQKGSNLGKGNPCSYMCPINSIQIKSYEPIEYSYLLTAGSLEEIREIFTENRDFDPNEGLNIKKPGRAP